MGVFYGYWKVPPARGPKTGEQGCTAKDQHRLAGESVPAARGRFRLRWHAVFSPASWDTCENILHVQPSPPAATGMVPVAEGCGDRLGSAAGAAGIPVESGAERFCHVSIGVTGPGTNHTRAGGVCTLAGIRGPTGILYFAPKEGQISPSPGQGPRQLETELRQHPPNARPPAEMPTVSHGARPGGAEPCLGTSRCGGE